MVKYKIETRNCVSRGECHPETCNHWGYYLTRDGERVVGSDDIDELEEICRALNEKEESNPAGL